MGIGRLLSYRYVSLCYFYLRPLFSHTENNIIFVSDSVCGIQWCAYESSLSSIALCVENTNKLIFYKTGLTLTEYVAQLVVYD